MSRSVVAAQLRELSATVQQHSSPVAIAEVVSAGLAAIADALLEEPDQVDPAPAAAAKPAAKRKKA